MKMYLKTSWLILASAYTAYTVAENPGGCRLPSQPLHGNYTSLLCLPGDQRTECSNVPETLVPTGWVLKYKCDTGYILPVNNTDYSVCSNGVWRNPLDCIKLCPPLLSASVVVHCTFDGQQIPCDKPTRPNTTAFARCNIQQYREAYWPYFIKIHCQADGEWSSNLFYCEPECGFTNLTLSTNSSGTAEAPQGAFPWLAAIFLRDTETDQWEQECGGTLISRHIVLTAAHCLTAADGKPILPVNIRVGLGKYYRDYYNNENKSIIAHVRNIVIPPHYSGAVSSYAQDIGLVDLAISVQLTPYISPACFDWSSTINFNSAATGHVAGWGKTGRGATSEIAVTSQLAYIEHHACTLKVRQVMRKFITTDKCCAASINGSHVDQGDSGGGLTVVKNGQHYVVGIVSTKVTGKTSLTLITDITNTEHHFWIEREAANFNQYHQSNDINKGDLLVIDGRVGMVKIPLDPKWREAAEKCKWSAGIKDFVVDCVTGDIYWTQREWNQFAKGIKRVTGRGLNLTTIYNERTRGIEDMTLDWIDRKLYWTDEMEDSIIAIDLKNREVKHIVTSVDHPMDIVVHPGRRKLYWSSKAVTNENLESANLDGSGREVLATIEVKCLAIDWTTEELCWCEPANRKIDCLNLDSRMKRTVILNCDASSLAITADKYYWIDEVERVVSASKVSPAAAPLPFHLPYVTRLSGVKSIAIHNSCPTFKTN